MIETVECGNCPRLFKRETSSRHYCSPECVREAYKKRARARYHLKGRKGATRAKLCANCGIEFHTHKRNVKFHNDECFKEAQAKRLAARYRRQKKDPKWRDHRKQVFAEWRKTHKPKPLTPEQKVRKKIVDYCREEKKAGRQPLKFPANYLTAAK